MRQTLEDSAAEAILRSLRRVKGIEAAGIAEGDNVFARFELDSTETIDLITNLEADLGVVIGEDATDFERMQTFAAFKEMLGAKLGGAAPAPDPGSAGQGGG